MKYIIRLTLALLLALVVGCVSTNQEEEENAGPYDGHYQVTQILETKYPQAPARINIIGDVILGQGPVSQWSAAIINDTVSTLNVVRRAAPIQYLQVEDALLRSLSNSQIQTKRGGKLEFQKNGETLVTMEKYTPIN